MTRLGLAVDLDKCMDTRACLGACKQEYSVPIGSFWLKVFTSTAGDFPETQTYFLPVMCQHCKNPKCVAACDKGVFVKREDGIVAFDHEATACATCADKPCMGACPYGAIAFDDDSKKIGKCDMCAHLVDEGKIPACAYACNSAAWTFGDLDDPDSEINALLESVGEDACHHLKPEAGTMPSVIYILRKKKWMDMEGLRVR